MVHITKVINSHNIQCYGCLLRGGGLLSTFLPNTSHSANAICNRKLLRLTLYPRFQSLLLTVTHSRANVTAGPLLRMCVLL